MTIILILLIIAVIGVYLNRSRIQPAPMIIGGLLGLLIVVVIIQFLRTFSTSTASERAAYETFEQAAAYTLGQAVAEDIPAGATVLVLREGLISEHATRHFDQLVEALRDGLNQDYTIEIAGPGATDHDNPDAPPMGPAGFMEYLSRFPDTSAVVLFHYGDYPRQANNLNNIPPLYVMDDTELDPIPSSLEPGVIKARIITREDGVDWDARPRRSMSPEEIFQMRYLLLRPAS